MDYLSLGIDLLLTGILVTIAFFIVVAKDNLSAIILFIAYGLMMGLAWVRLSAPDIAIAEIALGAGVTGAMLIHAFAQVTGGLDHVKIAFDQFELPRLARAWLSVCCALVVIGLMLTVLLMFKHNHSLVDVVNAQMPNSPVKNPVTAVLLNFRGFDTLMEMAVLFCALCGTLILTDAHVPKTHHERPLLRLLALVLAPPMILFSGYLVWVGADSPGGAFQAGALLASAAVLLFIAGFIKRPEKITMPYKVFSIIGLGCFIGMGAFLAMSEEVFLKYSSDGALQMLLIELGSMVSIGTILFLLLLLGKSKQFDSMS